MIDFIKELKKQLKDNYIINCSENQIGDKGMESLSKMSIPNLEHLDIWSNQIGPKGMESLSYMSLPNLEYLYISFNQIGDIGMESLSKMSLPNLRYLNIRDNQIKSPTVIEEINEKIEKAKTMVSRRF